MAPSFGSPQHAQQHAKATIKHMFYLCKRFRYAALRADRRMSGFYAICPLYHRASPASHCIYTIPAIVTGECEHLIAAHGGIGLAPLPVSRTAARGERLGVGVKRAAAVARKARLGERACPVHATTTLSDVLSLPSTGHNTHPSLTVDLWPLDSARVSMVACRYDDAYTNPACRERKRAWLDDSPQSESQHKPLRRVSPAPIRLRG